jgi:hypothetical protein
MAHRLLAAARGQYVQLQSFLHHGQRNESHGLGDADNFHDRIGFRVSVQLATYSGPNPTRNRVAACLRPMPCHVPRGSLGAPESLGYRARPAGVGLNNGVVWGSRWWRRARHTAGTITSVVTLTDANGRMHSFVFSVDVI